jgi:spermidine/putrescine transport system permease protein
MQPITLAAPAAIGLAIFFLAPLLTFLVYSFLTAGLFEVSGPLTLDSYRDALSSDVNATLAENSLVIGVLTGAACVALALPVAYWLRYRAGRWRLPLLFLIISTLFASYLVRIYAWRSILGEDGVINSGLEGIGLIDQPVDFLLYNRFAVIVALVHIFLPYVILVLYAGFGPIQPALFETAQDLGAGPLTRWRRVVLPLIAAPATSAFLFVAILSAGDYVTPQLLGGTSGVMLGVQIQTNLTGVGNWPLGAALAILMLLSFLLAYGLASLGLRLMRLHRLRFVS